MKVPYLSLAPIHSRLRDALHRAFTDVYDSGHYILGTRVARFEQQYAAFCGTGHCVGTSNGLDALYLCLDVLGVGAGDEVIVPSNTYIATVLAVLHKGASPVLVEPDVRTYNIDPGKIGDAMTSRTKVILPVHLYGQACEMDRIMALAAGRGVFVVEDNAQAQGAAFLEKPTGSWGAVNATSFYPTKNLGALGDAGAVTTDDGVLGARVAALRNYGSIHKNYNEYIGHNMRLDELQAAFLTIKLEYLREWTGERRAIAARYTAGLENTGDIVLPHLATGASHVYHIFQVRTASRNALRDYLEERGVETAIHYPVPPHLQKACAALGFKRGDFPLAETLADTCLSLPVWPGMREIETDMVISVIKDFFNQKRHV